MDTILSQILDDKRNMLETEVKPHVTIQDFQQRPLYSRPTLSLRSALTRSDHGIISEFKRKSPSKGGFTPMPTLWRSSLLMTGTVPQPFPF